MVDELRARSAVFVDEIDEIPDDVVVIFSAHGFLRKCNVRLCKTFKTL